MTTSWKASSHSGKEPWPPRRPGRAHVHVEPWWNLRPRSFEPPSQIRRPFSETNASKNVDIAAPFGHDRAALARPVSSEIPDVELTES